MVSVLVAGLNVPCGHEKNDRFILNKVQSRTETGVFGRVFNLSDKRRFVWMAVAALLLSIQTQVLSVLAGEEKQMSSLCLVVLVDLQSLFPGDQPAVEVTDHLSASKRPAGDHTESLAFSVHPLQASPALPAAHATDRFTVCRCLDASWRPPVLRNVSSIWHVLHPAVHSALGWLTCAKSIKEREAVALVFP